MSPMRPQECTMRAAMQYNDTIVIQGRLDDPGCVGLPFRLYMEAIQISVDKCHLTASFVDFVCTMAWASLAKRKLPDRRRLRGHSPSEGTHRGNWPGRQERELGSLYDPLPHRSRTPLEPTAGMEPTIGSPTRNAMTTTVPYVWMDDDIPWRRRDESDSGLAFYYAGAIVSLAKEQF